MNSSNVVYICSDKRSGSTLLDMLLGRHPELANVGELHHFYNYINGNYYRQTTKEDTCACERKFSECIFWNRVIKHYKQEYNSDAKFAVTRFPVSKNIIQRYVFDFLIATTNIKALQKKIERRTKFNKYKEIAENRFKLYETINYVNNSSFTVDSTKKITDLKFLLAYKPEAVKVIFLTRDLRAIATSKFKRLTGSRLPVMMLQTVLFHIQLFFAVKSIPKKNRLVVKYEDLIAEPQNALKNIFLFLHINSGIEIDLQSYCETHVLGGSPHRLTNKKLKIYIDDRWKENKGLLYKLLNKLLVIISILFNIKAG